MVTSLFGWNNYAKAATFTSGSAATNLPAANVANDSGSSSTGWQTVYGVTDSPGGAYIQVIPLVAGQSWDVIGMFNTNLTSDAQINFTLWNNVGGSVWLSGLLSGVVSGYGQMLAFPPQGTIADYLVCYIYDATNPDGFINIPQMYCGPAWFPLGSSGYASTMGRDSTVSEATSRGGQEFPALYYQRKRWNVQLDSMRQSELWSQMELMNIYSSSGSNVLYIPDVNSAYVQQEAIFGRMKPSADISYPYGASDRRRVSLQITERK